MLEKERRKEGRKGWREASRDGCVGQDRKRRHRLRQCQIATRAFIDGHFASKGRDAKWFIF